MADVRETISADTGAGNVPAHLFDVAIHNGEVTISNPTSGGHRTFKVTTILEGDLAGRRVVGLLTGPENTSDYQCFAFVLDNGQVKVWSRFRGQNGKRSDWEKFADMLERPGYWTARAGLEYLVSGRCRRCNRLLTDPLSIATGQGPTCRGKN